MINTLRVHKERRLKKKEGKLGGGGAGRRVLPFSA